MVYSGFVFENRCLSGRQARWRISRLEMWKITEVKMEVNCIMNFEAGWLLGYHFRRVLLPVWWPTMRSSAPPESIPSLPRCSCFIRAFHFLSIVHSVWKSTGSTHFLQGAAPPHTSPWTGLPCPPWCGVRGQEAVALGIGVLGVQVCKRGKEGLEHLHVVGPQLQHWLVHVWTFVFLPSWL